MGYFLKTIQRSDVIKCVDTRRQATVEAEDLSVDESCEREVVEKIGEILPHDSVPVLPQAFVVKTVDLSDLPGLVVTS